VDLDRCLTTYEREQLHELPLQMALTSSLFSIEDLNHASVKISEMQQMFEREQRNLNNLKY
jgi:hypothetical protein